MKSLQIHLMLLLFLASSTFATQSASGQSATTPIRSTLPLIKNHINTIEFLRAITQDPERTEGFELNSAAKLIAVQVHLGDQVGARASLNQFFPKRPAKEWETRVLSGKLQHKSTNAKHTLQFLRHPELANLQGRPTLIATIKFKQLKAALTQTPANFGTAKSLIAEIGETVPEQAGVARLARRAYIGALVSDGQIRTARQFLDTIVDRKAATDDAIQLIRDVSNESLELLETELADFDNTNIYQIDFLNRKTRFHRSKEQGQQLFACFLQAQELSETFDYERGISNATWLFKQGHGDLANKLLSRTYLEKTSLDQRNSLYLEIICIRHCVEIHDLEKAKKHVGEFNRQYAGTAGTDLRVDAGNWIEDQIVTLPLANLIDAQPNGVVELIDSIADRSTMLSFTTRFLSHFDEPAKNIYCNELAQTAIARLKLGPTRQRAEHAASLLRFDLAQEHKDALEEYTKDSWRYINRQSAKLIQQITTETSDEECRSVMNMLLTKLFIEEKRGQIQLAFARRFFELKRLDLATSVCLEPDSKKANSVALTLCKAIPMLLELDCEEDAKRLLSHFGKQPSFDLIDVLIASRDRTSESERAGFFRWTRAQLLSGQLALSSDPYKSNGVLRFFEFDFFETEKVVDFEKASTIAKYRSIKYLEKFSDSLSFADIAQRTAQIKGEYARKIGFRSLGMRVARERRNPNVHAEKLRGKDWLFFVYGFTNEILKRKY